MNKLAENPVWGKRVLKVLVVSGLAFAAGVKTNHIEITDAKGIGYAQTGTHGGSIGIPGFDKTIYFSSRPFKDSEKVSNPAIPRSTAKSTNNYTPDKQFESGQQAQVIAELVAQIFKCPKDPVTTEYNPPASDKVVPGATGTLLRICMDYAKTTAVGDAINVPLAIDTVGTNLPNLVLQYSHCDTAAQKLFKQYALDVNDEVISLLYPSGTYTTTTPHFPIVISPNPMTSNPCSNMQHTAHTTVR